MILVLLAACGSSDLTFETDIVPAVPSYDADVRPILEDHCVRCHQDGGILDHGVDLSSYDAARGAGVRAVCTAVNPDVVDAYASFLVPLAGTSSEPACAPWHVFSMPPGASVHLTLAEQVTLAEWLANGAQP